ncbi:glutamate-5-semialdehyde dehydrogenase [Bacteroidota bacterium]
MEELIIKGKKAREAAYFLAQASTKAKDKVLKSVAEALVGSAGLILTANEIDMKNAKQAGLKGAIMDRLLLSEQRIASMAEGLDQIAQLEDPVGEVLSMKKRPNGLNIGQKRVPIGVIGIIYESRPNVTADVFGLCLKTGNAAILRGGKEAFNSNHAITSVIQKVLKENEFPPECLQLVEDTSRESAVALMKLEKYLDLLIPRGGAGLIRAVVENSHVPVIETGVGNCHIYVDESADIDKAVAITVNAKTQRPGVCNAAESLLVHEWIAEKFLPLAGKKLAEKGVEIRGDKKVCTILPDAVPATEEDWSTEFLDLILSVKIVKSQDEAISHIQQYGSGHSEAIITENYSISQEFLNRVDAAAVYVNASTRFTDGFEFGFGAEIGISTRNPSPDSSLRK